MWETIGNHLWETLGTAVGSVGLLILEIMRRRWKSAKPQSLFRFNAANIRIHRLLVETRVRVAAARVCVVQFRNGAKFDIKAPIFRLYMTHEVVGEGIAPCTPEWSALPASAVYELLSILSPDKSATESMMDRLGIIKDDGTEIEQDLTYCLNVPMLEEGTLKSLLISQGTNQLIVTPLLDDGTVVGFVAANYRASGHLEHPAENVKHLQNAAANIAYTLQKAVRDTYHSGLSKLWRSIWTSALSKQAGTDE